MAIKKVLQDKRYKNRELQIMRLLEHPNIVALKHCFFSTTEKDELYLNLVLEYVPETVYRVAKHYNRMNQRMPLLYVKLYTYQICRSLAYIHSGIGVCHRDIKPQNLLVSECWCICDGLKHMDGEHSLAPTTIMSPEFVNKGQMYERQGVVSVWKYDDDEAGLCTAGESSYASAEALRFW